MCNEKETKVCPICKGKGLIRVKSEPFCNNGHPKLCGITETFVTCKACNGTGEIASKLDICLDCKGLGVVQYPNKRKGKCLKCEGKGVN